ncbi:MAG TPA: tetratricopeptide repeat protein, partial [Candidatus Binataceae bacterium]|nr:tetratricopeptide repeat protein [Candidatus Binataceae bacterium]
MSAEIYSKPNGTDSGDSRPSESPDSANRHFRRILGTAVGALLVTGMGGALYYQWASQVAAKSAAHEKASSAVTLAKNATEQAALCQTDYAGADYARAAKSCAEAASQGDPASERQLGLMYQAGNGVERNGETAIAWLTKAADHGDAIAQVTLGAMYLEGVGVKRDYAMALEWYRKAAVLGNADAQYNLGRMYYNGLGVGRDYADALSWLRLAATQGNVS